MRGKISKAGQWSVGLLLVFVLLMMLLCAGCGKTANADQTTWGRADAKEIDVNSKIAGRVVELLVKEGDTVKEGQIIVPLGFAVLFCLIYQENVVNHIRAVLGPRDALVSARRLSRAVRL